MTAPHSLGADVAGDAANATGTSLPATVHSANNGTISGTFAIEG